MPVQETLDRAAAEGLKGRSAQSMNATRDAINKQDKVRLMVPRPQHIKKGMHYKIPVTINGYSYQIPTGVWIELPEEVYLVLLRSGQCTPQRPGDELEVPAMVTMQGPEYELMSQGGAGSMSNPVQVS